VSLGLELTMLLKEDEKGGAAFRVRVPAGSVMHRNFVPASATSPIPHPEFRITHIKEKLRIFATSRTKS
jgi:hypothetical protein